MSLEDDIQQYLGYFKEQVESIKQLESPDFSVVLFRPNFMLASEGYPMKAHKNQRLLTLPSPPNLPCGATNQGTCHGVWWADAFAVT